MQKYFELLIPQIPRELEDSIVALCFAAGADGTAEVLRFSQPDLVFEAVVDVTPRFDLIVFFSSRPSEDFLGALQAHLPGTQVEWLEKPHQDWLAEWKKGFTAFALTETFWVVPSWLKPPPQAKQILFIDPGMAFGTGTHATTRMAARLLEQAIATRALPSVLEVGTGTGILAMLAAKAGSPRCVATDIDPEAIRVARENAGQNALPEIIWTDYPIEALDESFDIVVANIIDGVLVQLKSPLTARLKRDGLMVVSGILMEREAEFHRTFIEDTGKRVVRRLHEDGWLAFLLESI